MKKGQVVIYTGPIKKYYGERFIFRKKIDLTKKKRTVFIIRHPIKDFILFIDETFYPVRK